MERISEEELQENIEEILDRVEDGEEFIITRNGVDVAILIPYVELEKD